MQDQVDEVEVKLGKDAEQLIENPYPANVTDDKWNEIEAWLKDSTDRAIMTRRNRNEDKRARYRKTLAGERARPPLRTDASNISVPQTIWAVAGVKARLRAGTIENDPLLVATPTPGAPPDAGDLAKAISDFFTLEFRNPRGLAGEIAARKCINEATSMGTSAFKVHREADKVMWAPVYGQAKPVKKVIKGRVRWDYISCDDLLYPDGFGDDTQAMPFIGHEFPQSWSWVKQQTAMGFMDETAVNEVYSFYRQNTPGDFPAFREHQLAEIYFDYDITGDGLTTPLCAFYHVGAKKLIGLLLSYAPRGRRPIWIVQFDENPDPTLAEGQGVCEKLDGSQDEVDLVHNLGIEGAKRAIAHLIAIKEGTNAERELGGGDPILPGDHVVTGNPSEDIVAIPLGTLQGVEVSQMLETSSRQYVTRFLGLDESAVGNLEAGKRVPASLGLSIKQDSRVIVSHATSSFGRAFTEGTYFTFELWKEALPMDSLIAAVGPDMANKVKDVIFTVADSTMRNQYVITFNASDAGSTQESQKQALLVIGQYLMSFYDKLVQLGTLMAQVPPEFKPALVSVMQKMENSVRALLATVDEIHNADDVIPKVAELVQQLNQIAPPPGPVAGAQGAGNTAGGLV